MGPALPGNGPSARRRVGIFVTFLYERVTSMIGVEFAESAANPHTASGHPRDPR
jgi:hypothetical protein